MFYVQSAQAIVNAEDLRPGAPKQGLNSTVEISAAGVNGNSKYRQVSGGLRITINLRLVKMTDSTYTAGFVYQFGR